MPKFFVSGMVEVNDLGPALEALDKFQISDLHLKLIPDETKQETKQQLLPAPKDKTSQKTEYANLADFMRPKLEEMAKVSPIVTSKQLTDICVEGGRAKSSTWYGIDLLTKRGFLTHVEKGVYQIMSARG